MGGKIAVLILKETMSRHLIPGMFCLLLAAGGCAGRGGDPPAAGGTGSVAGTVDYQGDVQPIFDARCSCHLSIGGQGGLVLLKGLSYGFLVDVASSQKPGVLRVRPSEPDRSYLVAKVDSEAAGDRSGDQMPKGGAPLSTEQLSRIRSWIDQGALRAAPSGDKEPPLFAGAKAAKAAGPFAIELSWEAAEDPSGPITYLAYFAIPGSQLFLKPVPLTPLDPISGRIADLSPSTTYYLVVRAMDGAGNIDSNEVVVSATTEERPGAIDFDLHVLPILQSRCAGCHGGASDAGCPGPLGLCLESYKAIEQTALDGRRIIPFDAAGSELVRRIRGLSEPRMPKDGPYLSEEETAVIEEWIDQGATAQPSANRPPIIAAGGPYEGWAGEAIPLGAVDAVDPDGDAISFSWDFGDGSTGEGRFPWHSYAAAGEYTVTVTATDGIGEPQAAFAAVGIRAATPLPTSLTVQRVCSRCHGIRLTLADGRRGDASPPGQGNGFFPAGTTLEARPRTAEAWKSTVSRMRVRGAPMSDAERAEIEAFLRNTYVSDDARTETFVRTCSACHTPALAETVTRTAAAWRMTVERMAASHGAAMTDEEKTSIGDFLAETLAGTPPIALEPRIARVYVNRTCATCHTPTRPIDVTTGLPRADLRAFDGARALVTRMNRNGCGQAGVLEPIVARWLSEVDSPSPDILFIEAYEWSETTGRLMVRAWSSAWGTAILVLLTEDGTPYVLKNLGEGSYGLDMESFSPAPGRIWIRSSLLSHLGWGKPLPK
jgi:mono/diheme cytochrome c family protein